MNKLDFSPAESQITPRQRAEICLQHKIPDRVPVDFLATPEIWEKLIRYFNVQRSSPSATDFFEQSREEILRLLNVDCRVISYDMFMTPPVEALNSGEDVDWWHSQSRSTPNRMWRKILSDGTFLDIWGRHSALVKNDFGAYEEYIEYPLSNANSIQDLQRFLWPLPEWWDFSRLPNLIDDLKRQNDYHIRFRVGSVFEVAWQLCGMEKFFVDIMTQPALAEYVMDRITEVYVVNLEKVLTSVGKDIDIVYFYDDVATQTSLMLSKKAWNRIIRPRHARIVDLAIKFNKHVMYHCDGAISQLLPELIDLGIDIINPVQVDATGMDPILLKEKYGNQLSFHGGIDIIKTLRTGSVDQVKSEVKSRIDILGKGGGYILASSHHIQPDTPVENILAMYDMNLRYSHS